MTDFSVSPYIAIFALYILMLCDGHIFLADWTFYGETSILNNDFYSKSYFIWFQFSFILYSVRIFNPFTFTFLCL